MEGIYNKSKKELFAYLAGIIDGEGTITIKRDTKPKKNHSRAYAPEISVSSVTYELIKLFADTFKLSFRKEIPKNINRQAVYRCHTMGTIHAPDIIKKLYPYLLVKRKHAEVIFEFIKDFDYRRFKKRKKCVVCGKIMTKIRRGMCGICYMRKMREGKLDEYADYLVGYPKVPKYEIQRRERFYQKIRMLNAVGAKKKEELPKENVGQEQTGETKR